jgi:peptidoglycan/xylan/chitin deacetylase (PgdA/CDA1 family)
MTAALVAGLAAGAWVAWAWLPHVLAPAGVRRGRAGDGRIALTFDDGPDAEWTPRVLEILARHGARATFFLVGSRAARAPEVVRAIAGAGHEVANHSWSHRSLWLCGPRRTADEVRRCHDLLADLAGRPPRHFRPPWGMVNAALWSVLRSVGERCVLWSVQPEGRRPRPPAEQSAWVLRRARPGAIVDLHDAEGLTGAPARLVQALPAVLDGLHEAGYRTATVAELLEPS